MKITDLIKLLEEAKEKHGDLKIMVGHTNEGVCFDITKVKHYDNFKPDTVFIED